MNKPEEKASTLTLRLTPQETRQLEEVKRLTGCKTGSDALKFLMTNYPRLSEQVKKREKEIRNLSDQYAQLHNASHELVRAFEEIKQITDRKR